MGIVGGSVQARIRHCPVLGLEGHVFLQTGGVPLVATVKVKGSDVLPAASFAVTDTEMGEPTPSS